MDDYYCGSGENMKTYIIGKNNPWSCSHNR